MASVIGASGAAARNEDVEAQTAQHLDTQDEVTQTKPIDVHQSEQMFNDLESRLASESAAG